MRARRNASASGIDDCRWECRLLPGAAAGGTDASATRFVTELYEELKKK